jgi:XTP/dITP diphosphohydrolase
LFATRNRRKLAELVRLVAPLGIDVLSLDEVDAPEVDEDAPTFAGNAEKKARSAHAAAGLAAVADDSGLEVDALGGAPGVRSARFAGAGHDDAANNAKLLAALSDVADERRSARFRCAIAFVDDQGALTLTDGTCEGAIGRAVRGDNGFGYDPLFLLAGGPRTLAELSDEQKDRVSHRGHAMRSLLPVLAAWAEALNRA